MSSGNNRRQFVAGATLAGAALEWPHLAAATNQSAVMGKPALLGGDPLRTAPFQSWPIASDPDEQAVLEMVRADYPHGDIHISG